MVARTVLLATVVSFALGNALGDSSFDDCGKGATLYNVTAAGTEPAAVTKNMDFNISWTGDLPTELTGGTIHQSMYEKVLGHWIEAPHTFTHDLCELNACPVAPHAALTLKIHTNMPSIVPSGDYKVKVALTDTAGAAVSCADVYYTV
jgi:hypothetical protein